jgi:hypothetical protein
MTHAEITAAVRASDLLAPSRSERREESYKLTPGSQRLAGEEGTVVSRRGVLPSSGVPSHAGGTNVAGQHGRSPSPTPRPIPGSPRHA